MHVRKSPSPRNTLGFPFCISSFLRLQRTQLLHSALSKFDPTYYGRPGMSPTAEKSTRSIQIADVSINPTRKALSPTTEKLSGTNDVEQGKEPESVDLHPDLDGKKKQVRREFIVVMVN